MQISESVFIITGASEGLGCVLARMLYEHGARLSLNDLQEPAHSADHSKREIWTVGDIAQPETRERLWQRTLEQFGRVDALINNAGVGLYSEAWRTPEQQLRRMFEVNVFGALAMIQLAVPRMIEQGVGMIVNICSVSARVALPWATGYSASKAALALFSDGLRRELRGRGIHVMTVYPGIIRTRFRDHVLSGRPPGPVLDIDHSVSAERVARAVVRGMKRRSRSVTVPASGWLFMAADFLASPAIDRFVARLFR